MIIARLLILHQHHHIYKQHMTTYLLIAFGNIMILRSPREMAIELAAKRSVNYVIAYYTRRCPLKSACLNARRCSRRSD